MSDQQEKSKEISLTDDENQKLQDIYVLNRNLKVGLADMDLQFENQQDAYKDDRQKLKMKINNLGIDLQKEFAFIKKKHNIIRGELSHINFQDKKLMLNNIYEKTTENKPSNKAEPKK